MRFWKSATREESQVEPQAPAPEERVPAVPPPQEAPPTAEAHLSPQNAVSPTNGDGSVASGDELEEQIVEALRTVYDPEIPVNIYELGLIYDLVVDETGKASIKMTLTSPHCPVAESLPLDVQNKAASVPGVTAAKVDIVWDPAWNPDMMSEAAKLELGFF